MDSKFWGDGIVKKPEYLGRFVEISGTTQLTWNAERADGNVSAGLFFCLKYLESHEIIDWARSVTEIPSLFWQGNLMVWFLGALAQLKRGETFPPSREFGGPEISWESADSLGSNATPDEIENFVHLKFNDSRKFLPSSNCQTFFQVMQDYYTEENLIRLADAFSKDENIQQSTYRIPERLQQRLFG
jgi:hypothetical protein